MRGRGDVFEVDERRLNEINSAGYGELVVPVPEEAPKEEPAPRTRRRKTTDKE
jgi:hypothetical protein